MINLCVMKILKKIEYFNLLQIFYLCILGGNESSNTIRQPVRIKAASIGERQPPDSSITSD